MSTTLSDMSDKEMMHDKDNLVNVDKYREQIGSYMELREYNTALFWADKVVALSCGEPRDVYTMAQCMASLKEYHRAAELLKNCGLDKCHFLCHYLAVHCLVEAREWTKALTLLNSVDQESMVTNDSALDMGDAELMYRDYPKTQINALIMLQRGRVYEAMDNRTLASECYKQALQTDVNCFEAFNCLVQHQMLTAAEEKQLLDSLPFTQQCDETETQILKDIYEGFLKKFHSSGNNNKRPAMSCDLISDPEFQNKVTELSNKISGVKNPESKSNWNTSVHVSLMQNQAVLTDPSKMLGVLKPSSNKSNKTLGKNNTSGTGDCAMVKSSEKISLIPLETGLNRLEKSNDVIVSRAERDFYNCEYQRCLQLTQTVLQKDPYHHGCLLLHIGCLVELGKYNSLFYLAHELVDLYPENAMSWYAVGCYYYVIGKSDPARRYLSKATSIDRLMGPAWLAFGHSFAVENEHDQAMAAYFKASQLMRGCHLPMLYIGLECGLTNNNKLAEKFFQQAEKIAPDDPFVIHEMGVIAFHNQDYITAEGLFRDALKTITSGKCVSESWSALINNLGHACRKNGKLMEALEFHEQALVLHPLNANTHSDIGFCHALLGDTNKAVEAFHKALGLRREDTFSTTMLGLTIEVLLDEELKIPRLPPDEKLNCVSLKNVMTKPGPKTRKESSVTLASTSYTNVLRHPLPSFSNTQDQGNNTTLDDMSMSMEE